MMRYLVQPRDQLFVKSYGFLSSAKNMAKNIGKNISKNLSGKYSQKLLDHAKQAATVAFKTASKRTIQKTAEATGDLIGNKIIDTVAKSYHGFKKNHKSFKKFTRKSSESVTNENDRKIPKERYVCPKRRQEIIDDMRLI